MNFFIIGYMASGKTTFGKALAEKIGVKFIDLDDFIQQQENRSISDIFALEGEEKFRILERDYLHNLCDKEDNCVIACGGGTPCYFNNMELLNSNGITVFLETSTPVLIERLQAENASRPLMAGKSTEEISDKVLSQLRDRLPVYMESKLKWHGDDLETPDQIESNVESFVSSYPSLFR